MNITRILGLKHGWDESYTNPHLYGEIVYPYWLSGKVRFYGGGIKFYNGSEWIDVLFTEHSGVEKSYGQFLQYKNGLIGFVYNDDKSSMIFIQIDIDDKILLVRAVRGNQTIPKIDGLNYVTNGTENNGTITLSEGEYVLFYNSTPVNVGVLATNKLENNKIGVPIRSVNSSGYIFDVTLYNQAYVQSKYITTFGPDNSYHYIFNDSGEMITTNTDIHLYCDVRGSQYTFHILVGGTARRRINTVYGDDPNETTFAFGNDVALDVFFIEDEENNRYGYSSKAICHDTGRNPRLYRYVSVLLQELEDRIKEYVTGKFEFISDCYNYDEDGLTIGMGLRPEFDSDVNIQSPFKAYNGSAWSDQSISNPYSWLHGYYALRINDGTRHKYAVIRYIGSDQHTPIEPEVAVVYDNDFAHLTAVEWGDVVWNLGRRAVIHGEIWSALSDIYEDNPDPPALTSDPDNYDYLWAEQSVQIVEREVVTTQYVTAGMDLTSISNLLSALLPVLIILMLLPMLIDLFKSIGEKK